MGRKFSFFAWALGKSSSKEADFRRLLILLGSLLVLVLVIVIARKVFWRDSAHEHETGPHGGMIVAINEDEPHYHVEFVVERHVCQSASGRQYPTGKRTGPDASP